MMFTFTGATLLPTLASELAVETAEMARKGAVLGAVTLMT